MQQNYQRMQESLVQWQDEADQEEESVKMEMKEIDAVPSAIYPNQIPLFPPYSQTLIRHPRIILPKANSRICHIHLLKSIFEDLNSSTPFYAFSSLPRSSLVTEHSSCLTPTHTHLVDSVSWWRIFYPSLRISLAVCHDSKLIWWEWVTSSSQQSQISVLDLGFGVGNGTIMKSLSVQGQRDVVFDRHPSFPKNPTKTELSSPIFGLLTEALQPVIRLLSSCFLERDGEATLLLGQIAGADSEVKGELITELIAFGREKLAFVPFGGGGAVVVLATGGGGATTSPAAVEPKKKKKGEAKHGEDFSHSPAHVKGAHAQKPL